MAAASHRNTTTDTYAQPRSATSFGGFLQFQEDLGVKLTCQFRCDHWDTYRSAPSRLTHGPNKCLGAYKVASGRSHVQYSTVLGKDNTNDAPLPHFVTLVQPLPGRGRTLNAKCCGTGAWSVRGAMQPQASRLRTDTSTSKELLET